ncbi:MAG: hypothetical protein ACOX4P_04080 [Anaerovoracaceae bacterium]
MRRLRRKKWNQIRKLCGLVLAIGGVLLVIQTVPITVWYIVLLSLILILMILLLFK